MSLLFQLNTNSPNTSSRFNMDNTAAILSGTTPQILGYNPGPIRRMAYDITGNAVYMLFGTKLWRGRPSGNPNVDFLWKSSPLANSLDVVTDITGARFFGSMDTCGCQVAIAHWYSHDRKLTIYDVVNDTIEIIFVDQSTGTFPTYSACCYDDKENIYCEYTDVDYTDLRFYIVRNDGTIQKLSSPPEGAAVSLVYANGLVWRLDTGSVLQYYTPSSDTWTSTGVTLTLANSLHKMSDSELVAVATATGTDALNKIFSYSIPLGGYTTPYASGISDAYGGGAAALFAQPVIDIDLTGSELTLCVCILITRVDGIVMGFTTHDNFLSINGVVYSPLDSIQSTAVQNQLGTGIANLDVNGLLNTGAILSSDSITETELRAGLYDSCRIVMFITDWANPSVNAENVITGTVGEIDVYSGYYMSEIRGLMQRMSQSVGDLTSATCRVRRLGDALCLVDLTPFNHAATVATIQGPRLISFNDLFPTNYYRNGICIVTSGANINLQREIKFNTFNIGTGYNDITLQEAFPFDFVIGDAVTLQAGCDRTRDTCVNVFNNLVHFRGEPFVPGNDQLIAVGRLN